MVPDYNHMSCYDSDMNHDDYDDYDDQDGDTDSQVAQDPHFDIFRHPVFPYELPFVPDCAQSFYLGSVPSA